MLFHALPCPSITFNHTPQVALNPNHPIIRGTGQRPDIFMQNAVAAHKYYEAAPALVQQTMDEVGALTGRTYNLFDYYGAPDADRVATFLEGSQPNCPCYVLAITGRHWRWSGRSKAILLLVTLSPRPRPLPRGACR